ncbi:MAG: efflux RND transporter periplasmic adaptor subunit [Thermodesulfobacteriota bacterium]
MKLGEELVIKIKMAVLVLIIGGIILWAACDHKPVQPPPPPIPEVGVITIKTEPILLTTELPGRTVAYLVAEIRPQVSGIIQKRLFVEGTDVREGEVLYEIDPLSFQAAVEQAEANLTAARKAADRARAALKASLAGVARQKATLELARTNLQRLEELVKEKAVSVSQRDQAATDAEVAQAMLQAAEAQVESDRQAVAAAEAAIKQAEAAWKIARINLGYTQITAPISGRIGKSNVTVGALVTAHQPSPLATIQKLDPIYVDVAQSAAELLRLQERLRARQITLEGKKQNKVRIIMENGEPYRWEGDLQFRDITVDPTTGSITLRIIVPNPQGILMPGMFVRAVVKEGINRQAILVPQQAVSRDPKGNPFVLIVDEEGKVRLKPIAVDRALGNKWLVSSGLGGGEKVIVEGLLKVRPGAYVRAVLLDEGAPARKQSTN